MNYNKIKILSEQIKVPIKDLAYRINVTEAGLHKMIKNKSIKVDMLEKISEVLNVSVVTFFQDDNNHTKDNDGNYKTVAKNVLNGVNNGFIKISEETHELQILKQKVDYLEKLLIEKEKYIKLLEK